MKTYKITNTTNLVGRRDAKYNTIVDIEYIDNRMKKAIKLNAGDTVYLTVNSLPLSIHRLRIKKLISVIEISANELNETMKKANPNIKKNIVPVDKPKTIKKSIILDKNDGIDNVDDLDDTDNEKTIKKKTTTTDKKNTADKK